MLDKILSKEFLFTSRLAISRADRMLVGIFIGALVLAVAFRLLAFFQKNQPVNARLYRRLFAGLLAFAITGGLWATLRFLYIPIFGVRMSAAVIFAVFLIWLFFVLKYLFFKFPIERENWALQQVKNKYLKSR
ncbi:MAG: hypothetical protein AAB871_03005 [Patescibacteria group bacterium]